MTRIALDMAGRHVVVDGSLVAPPGDRRSRVHEVLAQCSLPDGYRLSPFEIRYAADNGHLHPIPDGITAVTWRPRTDLHTHFAGCVSGRDLVDLASALGLSYPGYGRLDALTPVVRERIAEKLEVPVEGRVTFQAMEEIYRLRGPLTKAPAMLVPLLQRIETDYEAMGIDYAELSLGSVTSAAVLRAIHDLAPKRLRFLAAISRHDDPEWDLDLAERIRELAGSGYIVGVDFMGHETNSTASFANVIRTVARPDFTVRVHAGESPSHPENVRLAIEATEGSGAKLRIGHGLYGVDDATLDALVRSNAIVEFNLDSNVALNSLQSARDVEIRRYVARGARVVLGSDGYGIYGTIPEGMVRAALIAGLLPEHVARLEAVEADVLAGVRPVPPYEVPDDVPPVHFTPAVMARREAAKRDERVRLEAALGDRLVAELPPGPVLAIAGAWTKSWEAMPVDVRAHVTHELEALVAGLDPATILVTGGTKHGVEGVVGRAALARNVTVVGAIVQASPPDSIDVPRALLVGDTLYEKAAGLYTLLHAREAVCLFVGGGQIVSDEIQTARNLGLKFLLFDGAGGASAKHAAEQPARAVKNAEEVLRIVDQWRTLEPSFVPHWFEGPNPTVDVVVLRGDEVLLIQRHRDAPAEPGKWALPGGYVASTTKRGERWSAKESFEEAARRELYEETGLEVTTLASIGIFRGPSAGKPRDPRDTDRAWAESHAFVARVSGDVAIAGGDDAGDARWFPRNALPPLAFDHARIIEASRQPMTIPDSGSP